MYSYGPPHMAEQKQDDQHEHTFSNYVSIRDVVQETCQKRWTIGKSGERGSGISVLPARHDDDDDDNGHSPNCSLVSLWLSGRILDWRLSQPGFDPSFRNLVCLATLKSSDRTKQICLWITIYIFASLSLWGWALYQRK